MKVIGITGPTGAGKTTALNALRELGAEVIDADEVYHRLLETDEGLKKALKAAFGEQIGDKMGRIDRKALSEAVFPGRLEELGAITHPAVLAAIGARVEKAQREGRPAVVIDAIALIESGLGEKCDAVVTVLAPLQGHGAERRRFFPRPRPLCVGKHRGRYPRELPGAGKGPP